MKLIANYGYKNCDDSYSVTMETVEDVPKINAKDMLAALFVIAKAAVKRQMSLEQGGGGGNEDTESGPDREVVVEEEKEDNGNEYKPKLKDPDAPATKKQKGLIVHLAKQKGEFVENLNFLTMAEASQKIDELKAG